MERNREQREIPVYWAALFVAVTANITANVALKISILSVEGTTPLETLAKVAVRPTFWLGILAAGILLGSFVFALRQIELSTAYIFVSVSAIVGISIVSVLLLGETMGVYKFLGILLAIAGLALILKSA